MCKQLIQLTPLNDVVWQQIIDLVIKDKALLLASIHELFQSTEFVVSYHAIPACDRKRKALVILQQCAIRGSHFSDPVKFLAQTKRLLDVARPFSLLRLQPQC
jgi:hypothetical protein